MVTTLSDGIAAYRTLAAADGKSPRTVEWVTNSARYFQQFLGGDPAMVEITSSDLRRFVVALRQRRKWAGHPFTPAAAILVSASTIDNYVRGIKLLFSTLAREGLIPGPHEITRMAAPKTPRKIIQPLSEAELKHIFNVLNNGPCALRNRALVWLLKNPVLIFSGSHGHVVWKH